MKRNKHDDFEYEEFDSELYDKKQREREVRNRIKEKDQRRRKYIDDWNRAGDI